MGTIAKYNHNDYALAKMLHPRLSVEDLDFNFFDFIGFRERPFKAVFNPSKFYKKIDKYEKNLEGLKKFLRRYHVTLEINPSMLGYWFLEGSYNDMECYVHIYGDIMDGYDSSWRLFKTQLILVMMHEYIHYYQELNNDEFVDDLRALKSDPFVRYYSTRYESLPLAHDMAIEMILFGESQTAESIKRYIGGTKRYNDILKRYYKFIEKYSEIL